MPAGFKPSGQDFSRTYFDDYKSPVAPESAPQTGPSTPPQSTALLVITQSEIIQKGQTTPLSWVSVGVRPDSCSVSEEGTQTKLWSGTQGTQRIPAVLSQNQGVLSFMLRCSALTGEPVQAGVTITVQ
jgi:hypothetical protein